MILPSLDQQLRSARNGDGEFHLAHIDTCLSCYLQDHHNRDGELLLGVTVDGDSTIGEVFDGLESEFNDIGWQLGESRAGFDYDKARAAIARERAANADRLEDTFDPSLERSTGDDDYDDMCQAWFLIHWDVPEDD